MNMEISRIREAWEDSLERAALNPLWDDGTEVAQVELSRADIDVICEALERQFLAKKKGRVQIVHTMRALS